MTAWIMAAVSSVPRVRRRRRGCRHVRQSGPQARLRVQQEVGRSHHPLAVREPGEDLEAAANLHPELHLARLEAALAPLDEHELAAPAVDHRALRDGETRS